MTAPGLGIDPTPTKPPRKTGRHERHFDPAIGLFTVFRDPETKPKPAQTGGGCFGPLKPYRPSLFFPTLMPYYLIRRLPTAQS